MGREIVDWILVDSLQRQCAVKVMKKDGKFRCN
jgi:hypothetical protein